MGMLYDPPPWDAGDLPQSHALAIARHTDFYLAGLVDTDPEVRYEAQRRFPDSPLFADWQTALSDVRPALAVIATPSEQRINAMKAALAAGVKHVFCEKPLALSRREAERIVDACRGANVGLTVNFSRRWSRGIAQAQARVAGGALGKPQLITGCYRGPLANNGSHLLDLALWFGGKLTLDQRIASGETNAPHLSLRGERGVQVWLHPLPQDGLDLFELDVICEHGRIRLTDGGHRVTVTAAERRSIGTACYLGSGAPEDLVNDGTHVLWSAYGELSNAINLGWVDTPALKDAVRVSALIEKMTPNGLRTKQSIAEK